MGRARTLLSRFVLGDMTARYLLEDGGQVDLLLVPVEREKDLLPEGKDQKTVQGDSLAHV